MAAALPSPPPPSSCAPAADQAEATPLDAPKVNDLQERMDQGAGEGEVELAVDDVREGKEELSRVTVVSEQGMCKSSSLLNE